MAKVKKAKQSTQLPLDDMRWWPVGEIARRLLPHFGDNVLIADDLTKTLASDKIRCMRRYTNEHTLSIHELTDAELDAIEKGKVAHEMCHHQPTGHSELVPASFWWVDQYLACSANGDIRAAFRLPADHCGPSRPSFTLMANSVFYLWQPDCVRVWPALQEIDARKAKPRPARKRSTRKAPQRVGTGSAIEAADNAAASGSLNATKAGDTAAVVGRLKRKRKGKLTAEQIQDGLAYLRDHPNLKPKQAYPGLRKVLNSDVSDTTLWRVFFRNRPRHFI